MQGIEINISYAGENREVCIVSVSGYIDTTTAPELRQVVSDQVASNKFKIIIDLHGVDYISSTGWGVFIGELKDIRTNGGDLVLVGMVTNVYNIYELMEFSTIIKSFNDVGSAMASFIGQRVTEGSGAKNREAATAGSAAVKAAGVLPAKPAQQAQHGPASAGLADKAGGKGALKNQLFTSPDAIEKMEKNKATEQTMAYKIGSYSNEVLNITGYTLGKAILKVIIDKPYLSVKEITKALTLPQYGGRKHKTHEVKHELKQMDLLGQRERYEFVMQYRPAQGDLPL